jgi:hypothetical protein
MSWAGPASGGQEESGRESMLLGRAWERSWRLELERQERKAGVLVRKWGAGGGLREGELESQQERKAGVLVCEWGAGGGLRDEVLLHVCFLTHINPCSFVPERLKAGGK